MRLKIKCAPEDFVVEELAAVKPGGAGAYGLYCLRKSGYNTADALRTVARALRVQPEAFAYGGRKDRHALTTQYVTVRSSQELSYEKGALSLRFLGRIERPMGPDLIEGNRFSIVVRSLRQEDALWARDGAAAIARDGYLNYFDDQRFGSCDLSQGFVAERLLKKQCNGALRLLLTAAYAGDKQAVRLQKEHFQRHWGDWEACLKRAHTSFERRIFSCLKDDPRAFLKALSLLPAQELGLHYSAFQAFIWNETARRLCRFRKMSCDGAYPGVAGRYLFYRPNTAQAAQVVPTVAARLEAPSEIVSLIDEILAERGVRRPLFNALLLRAVRFRSAGRALAVKPSSLKVEVLPDEKYALRRCLRCCFVLPRGSFGTMFLKRLFAQPLIDEAAS